MIDPKQQTALERATGHVAMESALTVLAAIAGSLFAPLLPVLTKSLAAERQRQRVEKTLADISQILEEHDDKIRDLTDEQYKIINETILALFQTTHAEKLQYLRATVKNALSMRDIQPGEAIMLSRVVRDISPEEAAYLLQTFSYAGILLYAVPEGQEFAENILRVDPKSRDALMVSGLLSLGLLVPAESTYGAANVLRFSRVVAKLMVLMQVDGV